MQNVDQINQVSGQAKHAEWLEHSMFQGCSGLSRDWLLDTPHGSTDPVHHPR